MKFFDKNVYPNTVGDWKDASAVCSASCSSMWTGFLDARHGPVHSCNPSTERGWRQEDDWGLWAAAIFQAQ